MLRMRLLTGYRTGMENELIIRVPPCACGTRLSEYLVSQGISFHADCGGRGVCGNCRVQIVCGRFFSDSDCIQAAAPDHEGTVRACRVYCGPDEAQIRLCISKTGSEGTLCAMLSEETRSLQKIPSPGFALDIGTTT